MITLTLFCLGTVQFGMNYGIQKNGQPNTADAVKILTTAYNAGIKTYDTAAAYGIAEDVINIFISQSEINKDSISIISKTNAEMGKMHETIKSSIDRIGVNSLAGYLFHDPNMVFNQEAVKMLKEVRDIGFTQNIGVSVYTPEQALKSLDYDFIDIIQVPYNILDRRLDKVHFFKRAKDIGAKVYVRSVLLQGLLMINADELSDHMKFAEPYVRKFQDICNKNEIGYFEAAVGYVLNHEDIDFLVFGVDNLSQLNDYISIYNNSKTLDNNYIFSSEFENVDEKVIMPNLWNER